MVNMVYRTHIGRVRVVNEDRAVVQSDVNGLSLAIVADGMGGHQAGDIASQMAIELIQEELQQATSDMSAEALSELLLLAVRSTNERIYTFAQQREHYHGMGTTIVAVLASSDSVIIGHIGDSRAYLLHGDGPMRQLTADHSLVNELVKNGQLSEEEAANHPRRNVLTRALGTEPEAHPDVNVFEWQEGDYLLLCSDGLSNMVDIELIHNLIKSNTELTEKAEHLIAEALDAGGDDNVTVILLANEKQNMDKRGDEQ
jgi:serine/threonine protein phosphatase PrpC